MAIDWNVPLQVQGFKAPPIFSMRAEAQARQAQIADAQAMRDIQRQELLQRAQQFDAEQAAARQKQWLDEREAEAWASSINPETGEPDVKQVVQKMLRIFPPRALELEKQWNELQAKQQPLMNLGDGTVFDPNTRTTVREGAPKTQAPIATDKPMYNPATGEWIVPPKEAQEAKPDTRAVTLQAADALARGDMQTYNRLVKAARDIGNADYHPPQGPQGVTAVVGADGKPVYVPTSQAAGYTPAGGSGGANRKIPAGEAEKIADITNSLDDVDVLERDLGTTGAGSAVGAELPNVVSEYTGIGAGSKQRQAVIDRVKQVIGKALEGGVLRKEDEEKYKKILPTISDPPSVAKSKIDGLRNALKQKRSRMLESLDDAGFDVSGYQSTPRPAGGGGGSPHQPAPSNPGAPKRPRYDMNGNPIP